MDAELTHLARRKVVVEGSRVGGIGEQLGQRDAVLLGNHLETQEVAIHTSALDNLKYSKYSSVKHKIKEMYDLTIFA